MSGAASCGSDHCITCGDDGEPMTVVRIDTERSLALCRRDDDTRMSVEIALVEPVEHGDVLLVHAGTAIAHLAAAAAAAAEATS
jgi:hydrogenase maturation factor